MTPGRWGPEARFLHQRSNGRYPAMIDLYHLGGGSTRHFSFADVRDEFDTEAPRGRHLRARTHMAETWAGGGLRVMGTNLHSQALEDALALR